MSLQSQVQAVVDSPKRSKFFTVSHTEIATENDSEPLLPNGGWDVHHHIFERKLA
jgi:hypothetical protein